MNLNNLYTSSFKKFQKNRKTPLREVMETVLWGLIFLLLFDLAINVLFPYPKDPLNTSPGTLNLYFDYGRSIERKVSRQIGATDETSALIAQAGWLNPQEWKNFSSQPVAGKDSLIACYGMSFTNQLCQAMKSLDSKLSLRLIAGPAAPPNHSFAAYTLDRGQHQADVVILGILASSVQGMSAMSGMTWGSEVPGPFTFPKYYQKNGQLQAVWPKIKSLKELRQAMQQKQPWEAFVKQLEVEDTFFDSFVFKKNFLDSFATVRMIRRAWAQRNKQQVSSQIHTDKGFNESWEELAALQLMVKEFAAKAQQDGRLPIVVIINDRGYDDHLFRVLQPILKQESIPYVSTHTIAPATNLTNFVGDGHFTKSVNQKIAEAVLKLINEHSK